MLLRWNVPYAPEPLLTHRIIASPPTTTSHSSTRLFRTHLLLETASTHTLRDSERALRDDERTRYTLRDDERTEVRFERRSPSVNLDWRFR